MTSRSCVPFLAIVLENIEKRKEDKDMARERSVTRTVTVAKAEAICMDITTMLPSTNTYELSGQYSDTGAILKALKKQYETDTFKVVSVKGVTEEVIMYGMPEIEFIAIAQRLDPVTRKPLKKEEAPEVQEEPAPDSPEAPINDTDKKKGGK